MVAKERPRLIGNIPINGSVQQEQILAAHERQHMA